ncbi:MAG: DUF4252 domain-containing protein [Flavobacteriales bacterium]|nr:DUF4252 domain-containing protein [Flavobacteriales bacterium]
MKYVITLCLMAFSLVTFAQSAVTEYFSDYQEDDRFTQISVSGKMFELMTHIEGETKEEEEMLKAISDLDAMKMVVCDNCENGYAMYKDALKRFGSSYAELLRVENKDDNFTFLIREKDGMVTELVMIGHGTEEFIIMSLAGNIDLNQVARIGRAVDINGLEQLEHMDNK